MGGWVHNPPEERCGGEEGRHQVWTFFGLALKVTPVPTGRHEARAIQMQKKLGPGCYTKTPQEFSQVESERLATMPW